MNLSQCEKGKTYVVKEIHTSETMSIHLNNMGCRKGEEIVVVHKLGSNIIFNVLDGRYGIDQNMAKLIEVE